jgi:tetratricopeptide (TPR) repeat protein
MLALKGVYKPVESWSVRELGALPPRRVNLSMDLVGRESEMQRLLDVAAAFKRGGRRVVFLEGEAGIGKTRLSLELRKQLRTVANCLIASPPLHSSPTYAVFEELLRKIYRQSSYASPHAWLAALEQQCADSSLDLRTALGFLLRLPEIDHRRLGDAEAQQRTLARAIQARLLALTRQQPLAIFLEDLHRADAQSLRLLKQLFQLSWDNWSGPLLLCATLRSQRDQEREDDSIQLLKEAALECFGYRCVALKLARLREAAQSQLLDTLARDLDQQTRTTLLRRAGGNPLFLELLVESSAPAGQNEQELRELVVSQIDMLPPEARDLVCAAAVVAAASNTIERWLLPQIVGHEAATGRPWEELLAAGMIVESQAQEEFHTFRHPLFQEQAYELLEEYDRWELHRRVAEALDTIDEPDQHDRRIEALAYHAYEGRDWERALMYSLVAGQRAHWVYDHAGARRYLRRAVLLARRLGRRAQEAIALESLGELFILTGHFWRARAHLYGALQLGTPTDHQPSQIEAQARRYRLLALAGERSASSDEDYERAEDLCRQGLELAAGLTLPNVEVAQLHAQHAEVLWRWARYDSAEQACHDGLAALPPEPGRPRERGTLLQRLATIDGQRGRYREAIKKLRQSWTLIDQAGDKVLMAAILNNLGHYMGRIGQFDAALDHHRKSLDLKEQAGDLVGKVTSLINIGDLYQVQGEYDEARSWLARAQQLCERHRLHEPLARTLICFGIVYYVQGHLNPTQTDLLAQARDSFTLAWAIFQDLDDAHGMVDCLYRLGEVALAQRNPNTAYDYGEQARALAVQLASRGYESCALRVLGEALLQLGYIADAAAHLREAWRIQEEIPDPYDQTLVLAALARLALAQRDRSQMVAYVEAGLKLAQEKHLRFQEQLLEMLRSHIPTLDPRAV